MRVVVRRGIRESVYDLPKMFPDFGAQHLFVPLMKNPDTSRHITTPLEMRRSALRDRNEQSGTEAIARIKAIAAGKTSRSAFLDDLDVESSPLSSVTGRAENKENDDEMSSDDESPVQPVRRTKNRLVRKSQLEEEQETTESPSPSSLPKPRGRQRAVFISDSSDEESSDVAPTEDDDEDYAGDANSALVSAMTGLGVAGGHATTTATVAPTQPAKKVPLKTQKAAPFAPRLPSTPPAPTATAQDCRPRSVPAPTPTPTPPRPRPAHVSKPPSAYRPAARMPVRTTPTRTAPSPMDALSVSFASPAGAPKPMRLKGLASGGPRFELAGELAARLYDHQRDGVRWMWNLHLQGRGGILADDMGLGKTLQVAAFAAGLLRSRAAKRVLCLAPTTLLPHWGKEFIVAGLKEGVNLFKYVGTMSKGEKEKALRLVMDRGGVLLTTYGMVTHNDAALGAPENEDDANKVVAAGGRGAVVGAQDMPPCASHTNGLVWDWIVCDEGHKLKNPNAQVRIGPFPNPDTLFAHTRLTLFFYNHSYPSRFERCRRTTGWSSREPRFKTSSTNCGRFTICAAPGCSGARPSSAKSSVKILHKAKAGTPPSASAHKARGRATSCDGCAGRLCCVGKKTRCSRKRPRNKKRPAGAAQFRTGKHARRARRLKKYPPLPLLALRPPSRPPPPGGLV